MKWIVLGVGLATAVLGGWWTWFGLSIVQVERGWSAVIAGSVLVAAGLVIMAIAALMQRVDALARALSSSVRISPQQPTAPRFERDTQARESPGAAMSPSESPFAGVPASPSTSPSTSPSASPSTSASPSARAIGSGSAAAPAREADILAAVGAAIEFSPAVATEEKNATQPIAQPPAAPAPRPEPQPRTAPPPPPTRSPGGTAPTLSPVETPSVASPPPSARPAPTPVRAPAPQTVKPVLPPIRPTPAAAGPGARQPARDGVGGAAAESESEQPIAEKTADLDRELSREAPPAPEPRIENVRPAPGAADAPAVASPASPARDTPPAPMLGPVLTPPEQGDGPKRKPSSFGWLEKARQRDQMRARKADENTADAPPVLSPGAPALDETEDAPSAAETRAPAPAPEPALEAAKLSETKISEAEPAERQESGAGEPDVPGALADAPVTSSGEGAGSRLVRRYDSQGVKYNLYEDGTIEAESESGMYRFASLAELRAFLEKRG